MGGQPFQGIVTSTRSAWDSGCRIFVALVRVMRVLCCVDSAIIYNVWIGIHIKIIINKLMVFALADPFRIIGAV